ncbi:hypothetical protein P8452_74374 [Trifolium repens]|nr:hypothetical protein QL285_091444 [Trifolium repens]WJX92781.1 hypothetical protein P8452_74374 [Trifolium repens]
MLEEGTLPEGAMSQTLRRSTFSCSAISLKPCSRTDLPNYQNPAPSAARVAPGARTSYKTCFSATCF